MHDINWPEAAVIIVVAVLVTITVWKYLGWA